ncbi:MAG: DUF3014 domain-containing protein [Candidatus Aminicenantales bacterium]
MDDNRKVIQIGVGIIGVLAACAAIYYLVNRGSGRKPGEATPGPVSAPTAVEGTGGAPLDALNLPPLELDQSDDLLRRLAQDISAHPRLSAWLKTRDIVRKFVAAVDNLSNGIVPRSQVDFFAPAGPFKASGREGRYYIDRASYDRYNPVADVFISLDTKAAARLYAALKPLLQEAYAELGYPDQDFQDTLTRAAAELLSTPVVEGRIPLEKKVASYAMADPALEDLSDVQKQFLRMGPENVQVVQKKLRELAVACGIPEYRLPKTRFYAPSIAN